MNMLYTRRTSFRTFLAIALAGLALTGCASLRGASGMRLPYTPPHRGATPRAGRPIFASKQLVNCIESTSTPCNTTSNPGNGTQGMPAWQAFGAINGDVDELYGMFGVTGLLYGNGAAPNPLTVATGAQILAALGASTIPCANLPALTGDATSSAGSCATTVSKVGGYTWPAPVNGDVLGFNGTALTWVTNGGGSSLPTCTLGQLVYYAANGSAVSCLTLGTNLSITGGTLNAPFTEAVNAQTGTTYTVATTDCGKQLTFSNASAIAVSVPQANGSFATCQFDVTDLGAGTATLTPTTSTINGSASLAIAQNRQCTVNSDGTNWQVIGCTALVSGGGSGTPENVQVFTANGTWTKPSGSPQSTFVSCTGGGGGGGSGAVEPSGTLAGGGAGGGGGSTVQALFSDSSLPSTVAVTIGTGGTGGAAVTATGNGHNGSAGGNSSFGIFLSAYAGSYGLGGQPSTAQGGAGAGLDGSAGGPGANPGLVCGTNGGGGDTNGTNTPCQGGGAGGAGASTTGGSGHSGGNSGNGGAGGGSGAGVSTTPAASSGGNGGVTNSLTAPAGGTVGANGTAGSQLAGVYTGGSGGGGGGSSSTATAGSGGAGGVGAGGGGGGGALNGVGNSGAGGNGGPGECVAVTSY